MEPDWAVLRRAAEDAAAHAYAPYSGYRVGAAGLVDDGRVVTGCNVENASYGLTLCAECGMVSELHRTGGGRLLAVACVGGPLDGALEVGSPCGRCRQLLHEAGGPALLVETRDGVVSLETLLPGAFGPEWLPE
jgi:cytidine deaminase